jgi:hypothetical protein
MKNKFRKYWEFADSMISRGLTGAVVSDDIREVREISCHGSEELGLEPCKDRMESKKYANSYFCGACNCGDFSHTLLNNIDEKHYSKLDYPRVRCPRQMPGFTNYVPLAIMENDMRKRLIEETFGVQYLSSLNEEKPK